MEKCCMVVEVLVVDIRGKDNICHGITTLSMYSTPVSVLVLSLSHLLIDTYVQFTVQQFYYFLIFTLRQIFCTKENRRTISSLFPDTPETRRWCAGAAGASGNNTTHFQTDLLLLLRRYNCKLKLQTKVHEDFTITEQISPY